MEKELSEIIEKAKANDKESTDFLFSQYRPLINSMVKKYSSMCADPTSDEDFQQESRMSFYKAINTYDAEKKNISFGAYAKICIRNKLISCVRFCNSKKRKRIDTESLYNSDEPQEALLFRELGEKISLLAESTLSEYEKSVFNLYLTGYKPRDISKSIGKNTKSVNNALCRIKKKLKRVISENT